MNPSPMMPLEALVRLAATLDAEIRAKTETLREMKNQLATAAEYKPGSKTGMLFTDHYKVKVVQRENEKWDQNLLNGPVRQTLGEEKFFQIFRFKFDPVAKQLDGYLNYGPPEHRDLLLQARDVTPGQPQVTFECLEGSA